VTAIIHLGFLMRIKCLLRPCWVSCAFRPTYCWASRAFRPTYCRKSARTTGNSAIARRLTQHGRVSNRAGPHALQPQDLPTYDCPPVPLQQPRTSDSGMEILDYLKRAGGVARSAQLLDGGFSRRDLLRLKDFGVTQPRRGVFALPDCDPSLHAAIRHNGRLSCASAAAHYGLWLRNRPNGFIWPATTATATDSSGTAPSGSKGIRSCRSRRSKM
jgi:hypothetical protein